MLKVVDSMLERVHLICDFDGTLWKSGAAYERALVSAVGVDALKSWPRPLPVGLPIESVLRERGFKENEIELVAMRFRTVFCEQDLAVSTFYPGVTEALKGLNSDCVRLSIVSFKRLDLLETIIARAGLDELFQIIVGSATERAESKTELLRRALSRVAADESPIYVGDTDTDRVAAVECSTRFVFAEYGYGSIMGPADARLPRFEKIAVVLKVLANGPSARARRWRN